MEKTRIERDPMGEIEVPADVYWGAQTARAVRNFPISRLPPHKALVRATVRIKLAAARANARLGALDPKIASAIEEACEGILDGELADQFVVDPYQAGAGTSHHMNVNEVIAARASEILGGPRSPSSGLVHPNDHVNRAQSTNDVFPTALRLAVLEESGPLLAALELLQRSIESKAREFHGIIKSGRTHLQDASPIRLGREIGAWANNLRKHREAIELAAGGCGELGIGGTATGTGLTSKPGYRELVVDDLAKQTGHRLFPADDLYEAMQSLRPAAALSGSLRDFAVDLFRISSDVRLLSSGPTTGLGELLLPPVQPGSSIMPGKVNPSIAEMVGQVCARVIGNDATVAWAAGAGQIDLNVFFPVAAHVLLEAETILTNTVRVFDERCIRGLKADEARCADYAARSSQLVLALAPRLGYEKAAGIAKRALASGRTIEEQVVSEGVLPADEAKRILDPARLAGD
ncbi:MAG TPA: aspartate ammonia-lyase [Vulgatibacter sp.]|nr:aspartate ammonia-lyase [Vulgatibacter sp.]